MAQLADSNDDDFEIVDELTAIDRKQTFEEVGKWMGWKRFSSSNSSASLVTSNDGDFQVRQCIRRTSKTHFLVRCPSGVWHPPVLCFESDQWHAWSCLGDDSLNPTQTNKEIPSAVPTTTLPIQLINTRADSLRKVKPTENEAQSSVEKTTSLLSSSRTTSDFSVPPRYGSAAMIPHDDGFDYKSIFESKASPSLSNRSNSELLDFLQHEKSRQHPSIHNDFHDLLQNNDRDRQNLVEVARLAQQDFIDAIHLD